MFAVVLLRKTQKNNSCRLSGKQCHGRGATSNGGNQDGEGEGGRGETPVCLNFFFIQKRFHNAEHAEWFLTASTPTRVRTGMSYGGQGPRWHPGWYVSCSDSGSAPQVRAVTLHGCFIKYSCCLKIKHNFMRRDLNRGAKHSICEWHVLPHGSTCSPCCAAFMLQKHRSDLSQPEEEDAWVALQQTRPINQAGGQQADCSLRFRWVWAHTGLQMCLKYSDNLPTAVRSDKSEVATPSEDSRLFVPLAGWAPSCQKPQHLLWRIWESIKFICMQACWKKGRRGGGGLPDSAFTIGGAHVPDRKVSTMHSELHYPSHLQLLLNFGATSSDYLCIPCTRRARSRDSCMATACRRHGGGAQAPRSTIALLASLLSKVKSGQKSSCWTTHTTPGCFHWSRDLDRLWVVIVHVCIIFRVLAEVDTSVVSTGLRWYTKWTISDECCGLHPLQWVTDQTNQVACFVTVCLLPCLIEHTAYSMFSCLSHAHTFTQNYTLTNLRLLHISPKFPPCWRNALLRQLQLLHS